MVLKLQFLQTEPRTQLIVYIERMHIHIYTAGAKCRVAAVKRLPVLHYSADYTFIYFGIIEPILVTLKIENHLGRCYVYVCEVRGRGGGGSRGGEYEASHCCI